MAKETESKLFCVSCDLELDPNRHTKENTNVPCPNCGSINKIWKVKISSSVEFYSMLKGKLINRSRSKKPLVEFMKGSELSHKLKRIVSKERTIDRMKKLYKEIIIDPKTKETIHHCEESLDKHKGHGSAKLKKKNSS